MGIWVFPTIGGKPPKWMVYNGKSYEQMDELGVYNIIFGNTHMNFYKLVLTSDEKLPGKNPGQFWTVSHTSGRLRLAKTCHEHGQHFVLTALSCIFLG